MRGANRQTNLTCSSGQHCHKGWQLDTQQFSTIIYQKETSANVSQSRINNATEHQQ